MKRIPKILFVDDDPLFLRVYRDFFSREGFETVTAESGLKAIGALESMEKLPDLMVLDVMMPDMNGFELLKIIKNNPRYKRIPVVMLTNLNNENQVQQAYMLGAILYLVKVDYGPKEIAEKIKEIASAYKPDFGVPEVKVETKDISGAASPK